MKKIIYNRFIPFKGYVAINLFGFIFARKEYKSRIENNSLYKSVLVNHELIHTAQYRELLYIFYPIVYVLNYFINLFVYFSFKRAYLNISFEREAYANEWDGSYINRRKRFAWFWYILRSRIKK